MIQVLTFFHAKATLPIISFCDNEVAVRFAEADNSIQRLELLAPRLVEAGHGAHGLVQLIAQGFDLGLDRLAPHVVEAQDKVGVARKGFGRGDILYPMLFPQAAS